MITKEIGKEIAAARKERGKTLDEIAEKTRFNKAYLQQLETGDFTFLPKPYVVAYIKTYAKLVGLDGEALIQRWLDDVERQQQEAEHEARQTKKAAPKPAPESIPAPAPVKPMPMRTPALATAPKRHSHVREYSIAGGVLLILVIAFYFGNVYKSGAARKTEISRAPEVTIEQIIAETRARIDSTVALQTEQNNATKKPGSSFELTLNTTDSVWIRLIVDGADTTEYLFPPGRSRTWQAQNFVILRTGNAAATRLHCDGVELKLSGGPGAARTFRITREGLAPNL